MSAAAISTIPALSQRGRGHRREQHAERHAAERREQRAGRLAGERVLARPGEHEQRYRRERRRSAWPRASPTRARPRPGSAPRRAPGRSGPVAVSDTYRIAKITTTIEPIGTSAQPRPRNRSSQATRATGRGAATTPACNSEQAGVRRDERERHARQSTWPSEEGSYEPSRCPTHRRLEMTSSGRNRRRSMARAVSDLDGKWSGPTNIGMGTLGSPPTATEQATSAGSQIQVYWKGTDGALWEADTSGGTKWSGQRATAWARSAPPCWRAALGRPSRRGAAGLRRRAAARASASCAAQLVREPVAELARSARASAGAARARLGIDLEQLLDRLALDVEPGRCRSRPRRPAARARSRSRSPPPRPRRRRKIQASDAGVLAEAGPQELAVVVLAEPVDVEDPRQLGALAPADLEPVGEVVGHVVAAERQHRHRVEAELADVPGWPRRSSPRTWSSRGTRRAPSRGPRSTSGTTVARRPPNSIASIGTPPGDVPLRVRSTGTGRSAP